MAKYLIEDTTLTNIADEVRELSGLSKPITPEYMINYLNAANADVGTQTEIIEEIAAALEGKAVGGGDSGGSSGVQTYTGTIYGFSGLGSIPDRSLLYTDENFVLQELHIPPNDEAAIITIVAHTPIYSIDTQTSNFASYAVSDNVLLYQYNSLSDTYEMAIPTSDNFEIY